jgi:L-lactate dehydrogenase complex protein LldG
MNEPGTSRQRILGRIASATKAVAKNPTELATAYAALSRTYIQAGAMSAEARVTRMIERLREYDAEVIECAPSQLAGAIALQLATSGRRTFVVPAGFPSKWLTAGFEWKIDHDLTAAEIEEADGVVTAATCGIADSGTIVLHHTEMEGRRVITLLPDWHLCILRASQVVEALPEYFSLCSQPPRLVTWISGPSATADIEMTRIKGVHGPRYLQVILVRDESAQVQVN